MLNSATQLCHSVFRNTRQGKSRFLSITQKGGRFTGSCFNREIEGTKVAKSVGKVKWFDNAKGYGFILNAEEEDVFVHYRSIMGDGYKSLNEGEEVEFIQTRSEKGWQAAEVERLMADNVSLDEAVEQEEYEEFGTA